jgi:hypothetical protein
MTTTSVTEILQQIQKLVEEHTDRTKEVGRKLHNGKLHDLYLSPDIITLTKLRTEAWQAV